MTDATGYGLGRNQITDSRDRNHPLTAALPTTPSTRLYRYWDDHGWWGDQGSAPQCVAYSWLHWAADSPDRIPPTHDPHLIYRRAQQLDEWAGENYDGTSVRAGAKALQERGWIGEYLWASTVHDAIAAVLELGPLVAGTAWYDGMFRPDPATHIIRPTGRVAGGHAYVLNGVSRARGLFRVKNSWGRDWGSYGRAWISFDDFDRLLGEDGEACFTQAARR